MNKATLIDKISERAHVSKKQAEDMIDSFVKITIEELKAGRKVNVVGFGSFEARTRHARGGINPQKPTVNIMGLSEVKIFSGDSP